MGGRTYIRARTKWALGLYGMIFLAWWEIEEIARNHGIGSDFLGTIYHPARAVVRGSSPYGDPHVAGPLAGSVYPPSAFVPLAWLGLAGHTAAVTVWLSLMVVAACLTLVVLGVRDARCYALWLLTPMVLTTVAIGNATVIVVLAVAALWRWRDRPWAAAAALSAAIAIKLFVAPLIVWLLATKRYRAAAATSLGTPLVILAAWATIGFSGIGRYAAILSANADVFARSGPYLQGLVLQLGGSQAMAVSAGLVAAAALLVAVWLADDLSGFTLTLLAAILLAPVAWIGYMALLFLPIAVLWPRWSQAWFLLLGTYIHWWHSPLPYKSAALSICTLLLAALIVVTAIREQRSRTDPNPTTPPASPRRRRGQPLLQAPT